MKHERHKCKQICSNMFPKHSISYRSRLAWNVLAALETIFDNLVFRSPAQFYRFQLTMWKWLSRFSPSSFFTSPSLVFLLFLLIIFSSTIPFLGFFFFASHDKWGKQNWYMQTWSKKFGQLVNVCFQVANVCMLVRLKKFSLIVYLKRGTGSTPVDLCWRDRRRVPRFSYVDKIFRWCAQTFVFFRRQ